MGFFLRPKDTNLDKVNNHINAEAIGFIAKVDSEFTNQTGVAVHKRRHPSQASEAAKSAPSGGRVGAVSRTVPSGFGKGTRAGNTGVRK